MKANWTVLRPKKIPDKVHYTSARQLLLQTLELAEHELSVYHRTELKKKLPQFGNMRIRIALE